MSLSTERNDGGAAFRSAAEIALAALLCDVGKVFQRADWPLSQAAEKLQDDLCPVVDGRPVQRHVLWTYDFCNDNLKWLAEYVDLARVMKLATGLHRTATDDPAAAILQAADRIVAGTDAVEVEELQPVIPTQVPLESILWSYAAMTAAPEPMPMKSRRRRRSQTSDAAAGEQAGFAGAAGSGEEGSASLEPAGLESITSEVGPAGTADSAGDDSSTHAADEAPAASGQMDATDPTAGEQAGFVETVEQAERVSVSQDHVTHAGNPFGEEAAARPGRELPRFDAVRRGFFAARGLASDEDALPSGKRPDTSEKSYRELATDLIAAVQRIGRMSGKPRLEWLVEALRGVLESHLSLVPAHVGAGGQAVSLYSHAAGMAAVAAALWRGYERSGALPGGDDAPLASVTVLRVAGVEEYLRRPGVTEQSTRVYHGRAALARLAVRLVGDALLRSLELPSVSRLYESDDAVVILGGASDAATSAIQSFIAEQAARLFAQTGGYLRLTATEPVTVASEQLRPGKWQEVGRQITSRLMRAESRPGAAILQDAGGWREESALLGLADRHGEMLEAGPWARLLEAYERQLGMNLARGKAIAAYSSPVTPVGVEGEATAIGPWFVHVASSPESLVGAEGLEQIYSIGSAEDAWAWVPAWRGLPHGPTYRRADESQLRADEMPSGWLMAAGTKRRDTAIGFEELGWLARRSRRGRGFAGRSWLACLALQADGLEQGWPELVGQAESLGQAIESGRQGAWFWQGFLEGQLRRADRATWRVFVLRSGLGKAVLIGPWNTLMVLASRAEQWWRRWAGPTTRWPMRGALAFGPRDVPAWQLVWQAEEGLLLAEPAEGASRVWVMDRVRNWNTYREALRLSNLLDDQAQTPELTQDELGVTFLRRLVSHEREAQRAGTRTGRAGQGAGWRSALAEDVRKLLLRRLPRRGERTAGQDELIEQLQALMTTGRRGKVPVSVGLAARIALWQNQGETS